MLSKKGLQEHKYVAVNFDHLDPIVEQITFAFQDPQIIAKVQEITALDGLWR